MKDRRRSIVATFAVVAPFVAVAIAARGNASAGKDDPVDLLRLPSASIVSTTAPGGDAKAFARATDGNAETATDVPATADQPLDVVYAFGDEVVSPEKVRVVVPKGAEGASAGRVEVLVSTLSAHAGYRSLRGDPLKAKPGPQEFSFTPAAAKWLLVRLTPAPGASAVRLAEVSVLGRPGPPVSRYAFAESPAKAFDVLARLEKTTSIKLAVSPDEAALFAKARAGRLDASAFAEATLLASGVLDPAKRRAYLARLDALEAQAKAALASAKTPAERGEALLRWLHAGPMAKGYVSHQTDLSTVLDAATFNCVSSACLYMALGLRLGLDVRAIEVPDHAFAIVYEGTRHRDVETTNASGFDPARDPAAVAKFEQQTGFRYIADSHRDQRREVDEAGLAAIVYYNHGVMLGEQKRFHEALHSYFRAMNLDPEFASAVKNALAVLANWCVELSREKKFEQAIDVAATGLALAPQDASLKNNHQAVWSQWADRAIDEGKPAEALAILARAQAAVPDGPFAAMQSWVYLKAAEAHAKAQRWEAALAAAEPGLAALSGPPRDEIAQWKTGLHLRWVQAEARAGRFEAAAGVLERAAQAAPDRKLAQEAGWVAQEWAKAVHARDGYAKALETLRGVVKRFPDSEHVARAASGHVRRAAADLVEGAKYEDALAAVAAGRDLISPAKEVEETEIFVFDRWAKASMEARRWAEAGDVYARALGVHPKNGLLRTNVKFLAQEWSRAAYAEGGAAKAAEVKKALAERFPGMTEVGTMGAAALKRTVNDLVRAGKWDEALAAIEEGKDLVEKPSETADIVFYVYDSWAKSKIQAGAWSEAADVYAKAIARVPDEKRLPNNAGWLTQEWAKAVAQKEGEEKAEAALREALAKFPKIEGVAESAKRHVLRAVQAAAAEGRGEEGLAIAARTKDLLGEEAAQEAVVTVHDGRAQALVREKKWEEAVKAYEAGLAAVPKNSRLERNAVSTWDKWARTHFATKDWAAAIAVYERALLQFPDASLLENNLSYAKQEKERAGK